MLYLALAFCMVLPLFGVIAMESGEVSPFIDQPGGRNGASAAYAVHLLAFFAAFWWVVRERRPRADALQAVRAPTPSGARVDQFALLCTGLFVVLALLMLFAYNGIAVLTLSVEKGEFRTSLGPLGAVMTLATKWVMPALFAGLVRAVCDVGWTPQRRALAFVSGACLCIVGASWGFKTTILSMLLPTLILLSWRLRPRTLVLLALFAGVNVVGLSLVFDQSEDLGVTFEALLFRLTALQGDLAWYTWERVAEGAPTPAYLKTFLPVLGDAVLRAVTGADPVRDYAGWASHYFGSAMTLFGGYPVEGLQEGASNQATLFGEALVIGGAHLYLVFSFLSGAVVGGATRALRSALAERRYAAAATLATFFSFAILPWMLGNGFSSLFYLINVVGAAGAYLLLRSQFPRLRPARRPAPR